MKLLEENKNKAFSDINHTNVFLGQSLKAVLIKTKINKSDIIKLTSFCISKEIIKQIIQLNNNNSKQKFNWKIGRRPKDLSKEDIQMADSHTKICSILLITREMQIKTTMRYIT